MTAPRLVFLVGFMGAGKTSVGRALARRLDYPFLDLDEQVEAAAGRSIREIFCEAGEAEFRRLERVALERALNADRAVVATGGGTFAIRENRSWIERAGASIFLDLPFDSIADRIRLRVRERPLFVNPEQAFRLYSERLESYRMADVILSVRSHETIEEIAERARLALPYRVDRSI